MAEYQGKQVTLNKPRRTTGGSSKFEVFVQDGDKVKRVSFGDPNMSIRRDNPKARANFRARHSCDTKKDKTTAGYWSCRMWSSSSVSSLTKAYTEESFKPHTMYHPDTGESVKVTTLQEHLDLQENGFEHKMTKASSYGSITKVDEEERIVYGYASVVTHKGKLIVDRQGDMIEPETMEKAATEFMLGARNGLTMHKGEPTTTIVHSMPFTKQIQESFDMTSDYEGWMIAVKVHDDETWARVKSGEFTGFSIGGQAVKEEIDEGL